MIKTNIKQFHHWDHTFTSCFSVGSAAIELILLASETRLSNITQLSLERTCVFNHLQYGEDLCLSCIIVREELSDQKVMIFIKLPNSKEIICDIQFHKSGCWPF
jgi:hypothetical protein